MCRLHSKWQCRLALIEESSHSSSHSMTVKEGVQLRNELKETLRTYVSYRTQHSNSVHCSQTRYMWQKIAIGYVCFLQVVMECSKKRSTGWMNGQIYSKYKKIYLSHSSCIMQSTTGSQCVKSWTSLMSPSGKSSIDSNSCVAAL